MNPEVTAFFSVASIAILWYLFVGAWNSYRVAALRQDLFDIRDLLFDLAIKNGDLFQHPSYRLLRNRINSSIRFAHKFTGTRLVVTMLVRKRIPAQEEWREALPTLSRDLRDSLESVHRVLGFRLACHLLHVPQPLMWKLLKVINGMHREAAITAKMKIAERVELLEEQAVEETEVENCKFAPVR